ncbi:MAG TPA: twin-arginine translocase TatA/TatE family subunit [Candidatus Angelobacter sp.]|nr:twin-arginine translocase TatA/TatE family subunit [Candidatus Angelobacter sp.]
MFPVWSLKMFGGKLGFPELILLVGLALLLFGPSKLADLGKGLGEGINNFKNAMKEGSGSSQATPADSEKK